jgi:Uma2 family endonuclease
VSPILVAEVLVDADPKKDLLRNVDLYFRVPSIKEYWILDGRETIVEPKLMVHRRYGQGWLVKEHLFGETFTTPTLPGFELLINPRL